MWILLAMPALAGDLTLRDALDRAVDRNPELAQARMALESTEWALVQTRGGFDPTLNLGVDASGSQQLSNNSLEVDELVSSSTGWSANVSQQLPTGGSVSLGWTESNSDSNSQLQVVTTSTTWLSVSQPLLDGAGPRAARYGVRAAALSLSDQELSWRSTLEQLVLDVSDAYWGLVAARESYELAARSLEIAEDQLADTLERLEEGFAGSGDVLQFQRAVGVARQSEVVAAADVEAAEDRLGRLIGADIEGREPLVPTDLPVVPQVEADRDVTLALARDNNAALLRARLSYDRAQLDFVQARNEALPSLNASGSVGLSGGPADRDEAIDQLLARQYSSWSVGLDLSVPLPARDPRAAWARAKLARDQAEQGMIAAEQDLVMQVEGAVRSVNRDRVRLELAVQTLDAARQALEADRELLDEGKGSSRNVVLSLEALAAAQVDKLAAEIDLQASLLQLQRVEGGLLSQQGLLD
jgi:outer membrane protein